jgi:hypothetical protein
MIKTHLLLAALLCSALLLSGCTLPVSQATVTGSGVTTSFSPDVIGFSQIVTGASFHLIVRYGSDYRVVVYADQNLVPYLNMTRRGRTLNIGYTVSSIELNNVAAARIDITMPELTRLDLNGASVAALSGFESDKTLKLSLKSASRISGEIESGRLVVDAFGASQVTLSGQAGDVQMHLMSASVADLSGLSAQDMNATLEGASTATVRANGTLDARASGASSLLYTGNPEMGKISTSDVAVVLRK